MSRETVVITFAIFLSRAWLAAAGEVIPLELGPSQNVKITEADGTLTVEATAKNPHFWTREIPDTAKLETHPVLAFEYFAAEGIPEFKVRVPKAEGGEAMASPMGLSEAWRSHAIDLRTASSAYVSGRQKHFAFILGTPVGHRFQIRNIRLREANPAENESMAAREKVRQLRENHGRAIADYLATTFPVPLPRIVIGERDITITARVEKGIAATMALAEVQNDQPTFSSVSPEMHLEAIQPWTEPDISLTIPRMVGSRDRATSCWKLVAIDEKGLRTTLTPATYPTEVTTPRKLPQLTQNGIKGLGGAHGGDPKHEIFELGIKHATVNIVLNAILSDRAIPGWTPISYEGKPLFVNESHLRGLDASIRGFTDRGILVSAILLIGNARHPDGTPHSRMVHPEALPAGNFAMPDLQTPPGTRLYKAVIDLLTERYTRENGEHGRIVNWILHNEIDQSGVWTTMGEQPLHRYIETFMRSARLVYHSGQRYDRHSRVFVSLTHHWTKQSGGPQTFVVRDMLDLIARFARHEGDFNWGVAYHPYPEPMFHPDVWNNKVDFDFDTAYITPKNIEVLVNYLKQPAFQYQDRTRGILLSEQGVNALSLSEADQKMQAAGIVYTMRKVRQHPEIEAYHYHAYRDSPEAEGGLLLGLTNREKGRKMAWDVYAAIDTPKEAEVTKFADEIMAADQITLVEARKSNYIIHLPANAPETAQLAARELQQTIQRSTGGLIAITSGPVATPAIRIVPDGKLPHDGFEIRCEKTDIIIAGNDTLSPAKPDTWFVPSHGTLYGVMEFLERFVGVRWLLPGDLGEDLPRHDTLRIALPEGIRGAPAFPNRLVAGLGESDPGASVRRRTALEWMKRQRLTNALHAHVTGYGHSWDDYLKPADMDAHPEWKSTNGEAVSQGKVKFFCTTAPGLVDLFARRVIETMDRYPPREMSSISPTDGGGFCTCERCAKLVTTDPHGKKNHAPAILTFYQQVGEIIARERPGRRLGGFVYYNYQYPPPVAPKLPDNLSLCWAPLNYYGYGLLKPPYRAEFESVMQRWSEITPHFFYHNYSTWMRSFHGAPLPVSIDILKRELPAAARNKAWGVRMIGTNAWGINAPINYLLAKQAWNAEIDVSASFDEWLQRAYGRGWKHMRQLYDELDVSMLAHKEAQSPVYSGGQYEVNEPVMKAIYAPRFSTMEQHYRDTLAKCATEAQRQRLGMFGDNLIQLHHALRKAALIPDDTSSMFHRDDAAFARFLKEMESTMSLYYDSQGLDHGPIWKDQYDGP